MVQRVSQHLTSRGLGLRVDLPLAVLLALVAGICITAACWFRYGVPVAGPTWLGLGSFAIVTAASALGGDPARFEQPVHAKATALRLILGTIVLGLCGIGIGVGDATAGTWTMAAAGSAATAALVWVLVWCARHRRPNGGPH